MMRTSFRWGIRALVLGLLLSSVMFIGCNEGADFDPDLLFSLEDYADDTDYAAVFISMMDRWYNSMEVAKPHLAGNQSGIPFVEAIPAGWRPIAEAEVLSTLPQFGDPNWYFTSFQDAIYDVIRFDATVPENNLLKPARVDYGRVKYQPDLLLRGYMTGDIVNLWYTDNFQNRSKVEGGAIFNNVRVLFFTQGTSLQQLFPAGMVNSWDAELSDVSALTNNPSATFDIEGQTVIARVDTEDMVTQTITGSAVIRSNGRGTGNIIVNGVERARINFESRDTNFHGYVTVLSSGFQDRLSF